MNSSYNNYARNYYAFVNGLEGAKNYPIVANQSLMLMDAENPVCYMKTADLSGKPSLKCFKLVEIDEKELLKKTNPDNEEIKTRLDSMSGRIDELYELLKGEHKDA